MSHGKKWGTLIKTKIIHSKQMILGHETGHPQPHT